MDVKELSLNPCFNGILKYWLYRNTDGSFIAS